MGVMDGIKVVEVAEHGFVPSAAAILADWGADVVKVERATGDPLRAIMGAGFVADTGDFNFPFEQFNRNKRGVSLDLRSADGRAALDRLIVWADVFITNFLPSARTKLRIEPEDVWAVNPRA
jgi:crotonobetainyl-CoA:carnitine CoA-transferase CaiB-like acyl-CoA transferase